MPEKLPSLGGFLPTFFLGGPIAAHLPFLAEAIARLRPRLIVTLGPAEGEAHSAFCQAMREQAIDGRCVGIRRAEDENLDPLSDGTVDFLFIDDCDSGQQLKEDLATWNSKLSAKALVAFHGLALERPDPPAVVWREWIGKRDALELEGGLGLGLAQHDSAFLREAKSQTQLYELAGRQLLTEAEAASLKKRAAVVELQQASLSTLRSIGVEAQRIIDHQRRLIDELEPKYKSLYADRIKAQLIMDTQADQLKQRIGETEALRQANAKLKTQLSEQKRIVKAAKQACRKRGRCFQVGSENGEQKSRRSTLERIVRELRRIPSNLGRSKLPPAPAEKKADVPQAVSDPYPNWIAEHEPDAAALSEQRRAASAWTAGPKISLVLATYNAPLVFLDELFASIAAQTYGNFEVCVADGGSEIATQDSLKRWQEKEPRLRVKFLSSNLGIAENTNQALSLATGDFVAWIDQDDLLAPFALYELARAIKSQPECDVFYSDEDRLDPNGNRHSPFFKPEWSPEYLLSSMYIGHLTAYRRELVERVGGLRKEFDLSQDYDFALRATEVARGVGHIPHVLYHWREHPASGSAGGKPQARATNLAALAAAMERRGQPAEIMEYPTANRARLKISSWPKVSIIVPTDSPERARACMHLLPTMTSYPDYEIVLVMNSGLVNALESSAPAQLAIRFLRYDQPFNFSDKCNLGARAASGSRLIFFNDDVESAQADWIENLIEPLENPAVGAVAPKLLYADGGIQHAGLVTGVRGLVGTACHTWPADSVRHTNLAQSMRNVSALSAACLAMRRDDFFRVGEFDAINTPIAHSDLDLCFKVRAAGLRCVYTPFATLTHRGHASIGAAEQEEKEKPRETASVYLLRHWPEYTCHDPYFPENMRDWLYADSPEPIRMWAKDLPNESKRDNGRALLFVSHDLSWSGAPVILLEIARWCRQRGFFVALMSPKDGPLRARFVEAGIPVIADPLVNKKHPSFAQLAQEFDCVIASTIFGGPVVRAAKAAGIPHLWWIHEGRVAEHYLGEDANLRLALNTAELIVVPDTVSSRVYQPYSDRRIRVLPYGIPDPAREPPSSPTRPSGPMNFLILGTIEQRKGQRVFLEALRKLPSQVLREAHFELVGRLHDLEIVREVEAAAKSNSSLIWRGGVSHAEALDLIRATDVMVSCSWDETGPLILMEALALGKPILSTIVGAVAEKMADQEEGGIFFPPGDATALAAAIERFVREPEWRARLTSEARSCYEKHFAFASFAEGLEKLIDEAMATSHRRMAAERLPVAL